MKVESTSKRKADEISVDNLPTDESTVKHERKSESLEASAEEETPVRTTSTTEKAEEPVPAKKALKAATTDDTSKNPYDTIKWRTVRNDGKDDSMIKLTGLKSLFSRQLPKMPRVYIARLVFDRRHESVAILSEKEELKDTDDEIIGGICFRIFQEMRFAE